MICLWWVASKALLITSIWGTYTYTRLHLEQVNHLEYAPIVNLLLIKILNVLPSLYLLSFELRTYPFLFVFISQKSWLSFLNTTCLKHLFSSYLGFIISWVTCFDLERPKVWQSFLNYFQRYHWNFPCPQRAPGCAC